jgi:hypothetical protein
MLTELLLQYCYQKSGKSYGRGRLSTVDLHGLDQLLCKLKIVFAYFKTSYLNEEVNCTEPSLKLVFLAKIPQ